MFQKQKLFLLLIGLLTVSSPIHAQQTEDMSDLLQAQQAKPMAEQDILPELKIHKKTNPEVVIFTHYKLAKSIPNIDEFAKLSPRVKKAQEIDKSAVTIAEYNRMNTRYNMLNAQNPIVVHTTLKLDEYSSLQDLIVFDELNDKTYFNYPVYNENVAIIPKNVSKFNRIKISKSNADHMFKTVGNSQSVLAEFVLLPEYADRKKPFTKDGVDHWLMLARIAEIRLWSPDTKNPKLLWAYRHPSYQPSDKQALGTLYTKDTMGHQ